MVMVGILPTGDDEIDEGTAALADGESGGGTGDHPRVRH
jgi:hypothetical protein